MTALQAAQSPSRLRSLLVPARDAVATVRQVIALSREAAPRTLPVLLSLSVLDGAAICSLPYVTMRLIQSIFRAHETGRAQTSLVWIAVEASLAVFLAASGDLKLLRTQKLTGNAQVLLSSKVLDAACGVPYQRFDGQEFINKVTRVRDRTGHAAPLLLDLLTMLRASIVFVGCLAIFLASSLWVVPVVILFAVPRYLLELKVSRAFVALDGEHAQWNRQRWHLEWLLTAEMCAKEIRTLRAQDWLVGLYRSICQPMADEKLALLVRHRWPAFARSLLAIFAQYGVYGFVVMQTVTGKLSLGAMLLFAIAFHTCSGAFSQILGAFVGALGKVLQLSELFAFLDEAPSRSLPAKPEPVLDAAPDLSIENLWFSYPGAQEPVLRGLNLRVRAGERLAIVGSNGAGKSTLMKVLLGLYEPDQGRMLVDNIDVKERSIAWRHRNIGVVFQDFSRFQFSARRNVGIGWVDDDDESRIWEALEKADADATVRNLSSGLDTALGPSFGGHDISGGQWQRVALARLFMHQGRLWLLDEPSAAMDPETEERTFRRFREWTARRTSVIVTHRLSTVLMADRIAVLEGGRVVETGTHAELVALNGRYTRLFPSALRTLEGTQDVVTAAPLPPN